MKDPIIEEVRRVRKKIESENSNDWNTIEKYLKENQSKRPKRPVVCSPRKLPDRGVASSDRIMSTQPVIANAVKRSSAFQNQKLATSRTVLNRR